MNDRAAEKPGPRILVPVVIIALSVALWYVPAKIAPLTLFHFITFGFGPLLGLLGVLIWWTFARRVSWRDRLLGTGAALAALVLVGVLAHPSTGPVLVTKALPWTLLILGMALVLTRSWDWSRRRWLFAAALAVGLLPWTAFRVVGQRGTLDFDLALRWQKSAEDRFLETQSAPATRPSDGERGRLVGVAASWPGFRGPRRDGVARGVRFATDWGAHPPRERWRHAVGPAWSSFAVAAGLAFTQEQRGEDEVVVAYALEDGREVWLHASRERFEEPQGGPGPRATPAYDDGRLYALGASGTLTALDAATGEELWHRNLKDDLGAPLPTWGFSSSPLVLGSSVIVFAGAGPGRAVAAYDRETGERSWTAGDGKLSYASPMPVALAGVEQVLMVSDLGVESFRPEDGSVLWRSEWALPEMARIAMPLVLDDDRTVMVATGFGYGTRRLAVSAHGDAFAAETVWTSQALKPYFDDAVCHEGACYGFDGQIFACIDVADGRRLWKGGRYGNGQVLLLPEMDTLLVTTEHGDVVLVAADPSSLRELARFHAVDGKTWNHPVVADGLLLVRNDEEAACYELSE